MKWICPYCRHSQVADSDNTFNAGSVFWVGEPDGGKKGYRITALRCLNEPCNKLTVTMELTQARKDASGSLHPGTALQQIPVLPSSFAKPQPDYIPNPIKEDYYEACKIRDLSPKASATLARRCLQGMIRDFCGISKSRLVDEIDELRLKVDNDEGPRGVEPEAVEAIDHTRTIGNIGAHMERDIGVIVPVDPGEAQALIELIEMLFEEWYVARHRRQQRLAKLKTVADTKASQKDKAKQALKDAGA